ncbi:MAG TPA: tetratricopeptide repeat protein [Verrucomicrobiae bacterium]|nr:tetratricopeptide repeat protein [Verrucomicrobiae bacterium]
MKNWINISLVACLLATSCQKNKEANTPVETPAATTSPAEVADMPDALSLVLAPHHGDGKIDREIIRCQANIRADKNTFQSLENLGWLFVAKARESFDPGYYKLAEQCAIGLDNQQPACPEALLLRGHVLQNLHKFKEAEPLARELVQKRGRSFDYGLLGDVLMEQGRLDEAAGAYQKMVDIKPDLEAYARIAHYRWLKGDLAAATELMQMAVSAASPNAAESAAWVNTRLAFFQFQNGDLSEAGQSCAAALDYQKDFGPALLLRGRMLLADGKAAEAVEVLTRAEKINPLPDYQWVLTEALHAAGRDVDAEVVEARLNQDGRNADPRTYSLYVSTHGEANAAALELAQKEFSIREDVFTHDALAWALSSNGRNGEAYQELQKALAEGTQDGRLFLHAAVIAGKAGHAEEAAEWLGKTAGMLQLLLPSEQKQFQQAAVQLGQTDDTGTAAEIKTAALSARAN